MGDDREPIALAIDIGGTFTDLAAIDRDGFLVLSKVDTTPSRLQQGVLSALERSELSSGDVGAFVHGSTVVINAITERRGARTALVTTEGFRDVLEIGRANRPDLYNFSYGKPKPFVPRRHAIAASVGLGESSANSATFSRGDRPIERVSRAF